MTSFKEAADTITRFLRVHTYPLAVKYVTSRNELPNDLRRPASWGVKMAFCQINTIARRWGLSFSVAPEDVNCASGLLGFGWGTLSEDLNRDEELMQFRVKAGYLKDREIALKTLQEVSSLLGEKKFISRGLIVSPLDSGVIEKPDIILIYGNPAQMARLVQSLVYSEGGVIESWAHTGSSCIREMISPMVENKAGYVLPGRGARKLGMVADDEMVFTLPAGKLENLLTGLVETHEKGTTYPINQFLFFEPKFNPSVQELIKKIKLVD